ncbi:MAG: hypothetical protein AAB036_11725 [Elusimicrobiota bacterium]
MKSLICVFFLALRSHAHEIFPIAPVHVCLRVEQDRIVADLRVDSIFWIAEIARLSPMPATHWPPEARARVESYALEHFRLSSDGKALKGRLTRARYLQQPWEVNEEGRFDLRLEYPPIPETSSLNVTATFYEEYRQLVAEEYRGRSIPYSDNYRTHLNIPGRKRLRVTLTPDLASQVVAGCDARRPAWAMALESLRLGAVEVLSNVPGFMAMLAVVLCLGARPPTRWTLLGLLLAFTFGCVAGGRFNAPSWLVWLATLCAGLAVGRGRLALTAAILAAAGLGLRWQADAGPGLPHFTFAFPFSLAGGLTAGAFLFYGIWLGVQFEYRRLAGISAARVDALFARRMRLIATALILIAAFGLWQAPR